MKYWTSMTLLIIVMMQGCSTRSLNKFEVTSNDLTAAGWELSSFNGQAVEPDSYMKGLPVLNFTEDGNMSGSTGCNQFTGFYKLDENNLYLTVGTMSKMACPGTGEVEFLKGLSQIERGNIENKQLQLMDKSGVTQLVFSQILVRQSK